MMEDIYTPEEMSLLKSRAAIEASSRERIHELWSGALVLSSFWLGLFGFLGWVFS